MKKDLYNKEDIKKLKEVMRCALTMSLLRTSLSLQLNLNNYTLILILTSHPIF